MNDFVRPPNVVEVSAGPRALRNSAERPNSWQYVERHVLLASDQTAAVINGFYQQLSQRQLKTDGIGLVRDGTLAGPDATYSQFFAAPDTDYASGIRVAVTTEPVSRGAGIRIEVGGLWHRQISHQQRIEAVTAAQVTIVRPGKQTIHHALSATAARSLAATVNALQPSTDGIGECGPITPDHPVLPTDTIVFQTAHGTVRATAAVGGACTTYKLTVPATQPHIALTDAYDRVNRALMRTLGLPTQYGL